MGTVAFTKTYLNPAQHIYFRCAMISYLLCTIDLCNNFKHELTVLFAEYPNIDLQAMGFPSDWEKEPLWR